MVFRGRGEDQSTPKEYWGGGQKIDCQLSDIVGPGVLRKYYRVSRWIR